MIGIDCDFSSDNCKGRVDKPNDIVQYCGDITFFPIVEKKEDSKAFTISCFVGPFNVRHAFRRVKAKIKLIPLVI